MSWVLILTSSHNEPPAVIGGYPNREAAEEAGMLATEQSTDAAQPAAQFYRFTVIPGAAAEGPVGMTTSRTGRDIEYDQGKPAATPYRHTRRHP